MQIFKEKRSNSFVGLVEKVPSYVIHRPDAKSKWETLEGSVGCSGCMHCDTPKCLNYDKSRVSSEVIEFTCDNTLNVCPVDAIYWDKQKSMPVINKEKCILCGLCARECPTGAIYYSNNEMAIAESDDIKLVEATEANMVQHIHQLEQFAEAYHAGYLVKENDQFLEKIYSKLFRLGGNAPNLVARNILVSLGNHCAIGRVGDVYTRVDAILKTKNSGTAVVEVEFGKDTLDAARGVLDDIAVANCRYNLPVKELLSLVVCLQLPNERQGYWQVIKDVKKVEGISINTVTIGCLLILLWNLQEFNISENNFYADYDNMSIRKNTEFILDGDIGISERYLGIFEPEK